MTKKSALKIVIAYENLDAGIRAKEMSERVTSILTSEYVPSSNMYRFNFLNDRELREQAIINAALADMVIIATDESGELPDHVKTWMEDWMPCRRKQQSALVALLGNDDGQSWTAGLTRDYLQQVATKAQIDFFCQTNESAPSRHTLPTPQIESDAPVLVEVSGDSRWRGWGLNE